MVGSVASNHDRYMLYLLLCVYEIFLASLLKEADILSHFIHSV